MYYPRIAYPAPIIAAYFLMEYKKESSFLASEFCSFPEISKYRNKPLTLSTLQYFFGFNWGRDDREIMDMSNDKMSLELCYTRINGQSDRGVESNDENNTGSGTDTGVEDVFRTNESWPRYQLPRTNVKSENVTDERVKNEQHVF